MTGRETMVRSGVKLKEVARLVENGQTGKKVILPLNQAALTFRIPQDNLRGMGRRRQNLGIQVMGNNLEVTLNGSEFDRRKSYQMLYAIVQNCGNSHAIRTLLERGFSNDLNDLIEQVPAVKEPVEILKEGKACLTDEDQTIMCVELYSLWLSLKDKSGLHLPENALNAVAY